MADVYFSESDPVRLLGTLAGKENIKWEKDLPIKIHPGAIGNTAYLKPEKYSDIIMYLKSLELSPYFIETCMAGEDSSGKLKEFKEHNFDKLLPIVIADGEKGNEEVKIEVKNGKHLKYGMIGKKLAEAKQILVVSHFKGHCMAGFGGALKMLGIGFESGRGKVLVHGNKSEYQDGDTVNWDLSHKEGISRKWVQNWNEEIVSAGTVFRERVAESAWAAIQNKQLIYVTFAINLANNCDCDGKEVEIVYKDLGIFASTDPVAIDKAVFDMLAEREGEDPFEGKEIFEYAEKIGLGTTGYNLNKV